MAAPLQRTVSKLIWAEIVHQDWGLSSLAPQEKTRTGYSSSSSEFTLSHLAKKQLRDCGYTPPQLKVSGKQKWETAF